MPAAWTGFPTDPERKLAELPRTFDELQAFLNGRKDKIDQRSSRVENSDGGGSGSGGGGIGTQARPFRQYVEKSFMLGVDGYWSKRDSGTWSFILSGGLALNTKWGKIQYSDPDTGRLMTKWYYFNEKSEMATGWIFLDGQWYYLDPVKGEMYTGWHMIGSRWYYFTPSAVAGCQGSLFTIRHHLTDTG